MIATQKKADLRGREKDGAVDPAPLRPSLGNGTSIAKFPPDRVIFVQGAPCDAIFLLRRGIAKVSVLSEMGREAIILILGQGDFFGEGGLEGNVQRLTTTTAMTECMIERIEPSAMQRALRDQPQFSRMFMDNLLTQKLRLLEVLTDHHFHSTEMRLARTLMRLAKIGTNDRFDAALPRISQATLAEMIGTTRSRVNFFMTKFRRLGLIDYNGKLVVHRSLSGILRRE